MNSRKALSRIICIIVVELLLVAFVVWFFDIFYQYHSPFLGLDAVFSDHDNQMPGSVRNFDYDSVLVGSSVAENFDTDELDAFFGCNTLKIIKATGTCDDLLYYLDMSREKHTLKNVFWCLDIFAVESSEGLRIFNAGADRYLHTATILDDTPYLFNKEILLEKIPAWVVSSVKGINTRGKAYNWAEGKTFSAQAVAGRYERVYMTDDDIPVVAESEYKDTVDENVGKVADFVGNNPDTEFIFVIPPYSLFWWDSGYVNGILDMHIYSLERIFETVNSLDNAKVFFFGNNEEIVLNADNYMDILHYSPEINEFIVEAVEKGEYEVTAENRGDVISDLKAIVEKIEESEIGKYYELGGE